MTLTLAESTRSCVLCTVYINIEHCYKHISGATNNVFGIEPDRWLVVAAVDHGTRFRLGSHDRSMKFVLLSVREII